MATVNLGAIKFNWKGAYSNSTAYAVDDVVSSGGSSYVCIQAHTNQPVGNATAYWNIMSSAGTNGTNGTDVGTVITTQGDILYRDGSGLQRLPKGTAGQVLQMNSGATAPEYGTVSSDYVKLASVSATSGTSVSIDGYFNDTIYAMYKIVVYNNESSTNDWWKLQFNTGGSAYTSSNYKWIADYSRQNAGTITNNREGGNNVSYLPINWWGSNTSDQPNISEVTITQPQSTSQTKPFLCHNVSNDNGNITRFDIAGNFDTQTASTGVTIFPNAGNILRLNATLWGVKK